jgi:hypothetical protein
MTKRAKKRNPKTILKLPDLEHSKAAVLNSLSLSEIPALPRPCRPGLH